MRRERITFVGGDLVATVIAAIDARYRYVLANLVNVGPVFVVRPIDLSKVLGGVV
ncbi:hypothetical protein D3C81_2333700 [compost metagenome]